MQPRDLESYIESDLNEIYIYIYECDFGIKNSSHFI